MVQQLRHPLPMQGVQFQSLVGELRFLTPHSQKQQKEIKQKQYCDKSVTLKMVHIIKIFKKKFQIEVSPVHGED